MSFTNIIEPLEKLLKLQKSLLTVALQKTEIVKKGDLTAMQQILKDEQAHLSAIRSLENQVLSISKSTSQKAHPTLTDIIESADGQSKVELLRLQAEFSELVTTLSERNKLNQNLLEQSLQFINLSLDLLVPSIDSYNYGNQNLANEYEHPNRSIFNSKA